MNLCMCEAVCITRIALTNSHSIGLRTSYLVVMAICKHFDPRITCPLNLVVYVSFLLIFFSMEKYFFCGTHDWILIPFSKKENIGYIDFLDWSVFDNILQA